MRSNNLFRLGVYNSVSIIIKIIASIISTKALAFFIGASGLGLIGVFKEFFNMSSNVASLGINKGIIKYVAQLKKDQEDTKVFLTTVNFLGLGFSIFIGAFIYLFSYNISSYLFGNYSYTLVFRVLAFILPISTVTSYFVSFLNGLGFSKSIIRINILSYILNMIALIAMTYKYQVIGALISISVFYVWQLIAIVFFVPKKVRYIVVTYAKFKKLFASRVMGYTVMTITSLMLFPLISILIRTEIINVLGENEAGFWEAMKRISENYLLFASTLVTLSVLPKLSGEGGSERFRYIVVDFYKTIIPFVIIGFIMLYLLRDVIVLIFFSKDFLPTGLLFKWYTIGDIFRIMGVVLSANFFARRDVKGYILTDFFLATVMYFLSIWLIKGYGLEGGGAAYMISYLLYLILLLLVFQKSLFTRKK